MDGGFWRKSRDFLLYLTSPTQTPPFLSKQRCCFPSLSLPFFFFPQESRYGIGRNTNEQTNKKPREIIFALNHAEKGPLLSNGTEQPRLFWEKKKKKQEFNGKSAGNKMGFASLEMFCRNVCDFSSSPAPVLPALSSGTMGMARAQSSPPSSRLPFLEN